MFFRNIIYCIKKYDKQILELDKKLQITMKISKGKENYSVMNYKISIN